jgi:hypothetical protein
MIFSSTQKGKPTMTIPTDTLGQLIWWFERRVVSHKESLDKFQEKFANDPIYAFEWAGETVLTAARYHYETIALRWLKGEESPNFTGDRIAELRKSWTEELARMTRHQRWSSTSQLANAAEEAKRIALAQLVEELPEPEPVLAPDAVELRNAIVKELTEARLNAGRVAMEKATQKETRFREGVTVGFQRALDRVLAWKPQT